MERVESALKSSIRKEMASPVYEEVYAVNTTTAQQNVFTADDFSVDDLLDLPNDDLFAGLEEDSDEPKPPQEILSSEEPNDDPLLRSNNDFSGIEDFGSLPTSDDLSVPADESLEWLSHFVEDSFTENSAPNLTGAPIEKPAWLTNDRKHPVRPVTEESCFKSLVPAKARSKRNRNGLKVWALGSSSSSGPSSSSSTSSTSSSGPSSPWLSGGEMLESMVLYEKPPVPKKHKKRSAESVFASQLLQPPRRCSHCGVQKTPQWRAGPMGAKTLCNACGVRYKSGRLLPEYRPACSPTFSSELHSNHHRKVMEMRRKKEPTDDDNETGLNQMVQSPRAVPSF